MRSRDRHNKIVDMIDSCKTHDQLKGLIPFIKNQPLDAKSKLRLFDFMSIKNGQLSINMVHNELQKLKKFL